MKTKLIILMIVLLSFVINPLKLSAQVYESWNNSFTDYSSASSDFLNQSNMYYQQEMNSLSSLPGFAGGDFLTLNISGLLRGAGDDEGMDTGDDTSGNDNPFYANDVPISDGILPLLLAVFGWIVVILLSPRLLHKERELAKRRKRMTCENNNNSK